MTPVVTTVAARHPSNVSFTCRICGRDLPPAGGPTCSRACSAAGLDAVDARLEATIEALLAARARSATICPSEACRAVFGDVAADHMQQTRRAARRLVAAGRIVITSGGAVVDPSRARGPIRLRRVEHLVEPARVPRRRRPHDLDGGQG
jgi:hypothetical protein